MTSGEQRLAHPCPWPGCIKTYKRLDHLERHQKSHSGDLNYRCHLCHRQYSRSDVLNRHLVQTHGEKTARAGRPRRAACIACVEERVACDGVPPKICSRCRDATRQCRYRHLEIEASPPSPRASLGCSGSAGSGSGFEFSPLAPAVGLAALGDASEAAREGDVLGIWPPASWATELILSATNQSGLPALPPDWFYEQDDGGFAEGEGRLRPDGQDSLWARVSATVASPDELIGSLPEDGGAGINPAARGMMQTLTQHAHRPLWAAPDNLPSEGTLTTWVNMYARHFAAWLPIADSPFGDKPPLLLKALAGMGSVFARDSQGLGLMEMVRRDLLFITEHDARFTYDVAVVQATLLCAVYGAFSGSPRLAQHAEVARAALVASARRMRLLRPGGRGEEALEEHRRRRLGWCIFLFDAQLAALFGTTPLFPLSEIDVPLPPAEEGTPFSAVLSALLENGTLPPAPDDLALSVLAYTLTRKCLDAAAARVFGAWDEEGEYALPMPGYKLHPQAVLDKLAQHTLRASAPSHLVVSCAAVAYHAHLRFAAPRLLEDIQAAAGRVGPTAAEQAQGRLAGWMAAQPRRARDVMAHAAMLFTLMGRFVFDTPPEAVWAFDAALCLWAVLEFGGLTEGEVVSVSWTSTPALEAWIESGAGSLAIQGVALDGRAVLLAAADRLGALSWGVAARYRRVLIGLAGEHVRRGSG